tara:strand:- start:1427 stop:2185 length:759 start_codon:yes stop_codon:yes gene_type:complete
MKQFRTFISTSNKYTDILQDHAVLYNRFCKIPMTLEVLGFDPPTEPYPSNYEFVSMGKQEDFPNKNWADPIRPVIEGVEENYFGFWWDDFFPIGEMQEDLLEEAVNLVKDGKAEKVHFFFGSRAQYHSSKTFNENFNVLTQTAEYRSALATGIWDKEYFLKNLQPGMTCWDYEVKNFLSTTNDGATILIPKRRPIMPWVNMFRQGNFNTVMWEKYKNSPTGHFAWNKFQTLTPEVAEVVQQYHPTLGTRQLR